MGPVTLQELCAPYSRMRIATANDNDEILALLDTLAMTTQKGGLKFSRNPDFFAISPVQAEKSATILILNENGKVGGFGTITGTQMMVQGELKYFGYACDLRLSPTLDRLARDHFRLWYADLALYLRQIQDFGPIQHWITSIFDENETAKNFLIGKKNRFQNKVIHRPIFKYQNINILGRLPFNKATHFKVSLCNHGQISQLKLFLTTNIRHAEFYWSIQELERKKHVLGFAWEDFLIVEVDDKIVAAALPISDLDYRKAILVNMNVPMKLLGWALPLIGKSAISEGQSIRSGYLGFLKVSFANLTEKTNLISALIEFSLKLENLKPKNLRFQTLTFMESQDPSLVKELRKKGFVLTAIPATLYEVVHKENYCRTKLLRRKKEGRPDFEISFL